MSLAAINASFNGLSAFLILCGFGAIRARRHRLHKRLMLAAFVSSSLFLVGYLTRMSVYGSTHFQGTGALRTVYFSILISHMILAAAVPPLVLRTLYLALKGRLAAHRRIVRWTLPIWLYVSVTGVVIYWMLYQL